MTTSPAHILLEGKIEQSHGVCVLTDFTNLPTFLDKASPVPSPLRPAYKEPDTLHKE